MADDSLAQELAGGEWSDEAIRVLICDDHALFRTGVVAALAGADEQLGARPVEPEALRDGI